MIVSMNANPSRELAKLQVEGSLLKMPNLNGNLGVEMYHHPQKSTNVMAGRQLEGQLRSISPPVHAELYKYRKQNQKSVSFPQRQTLQELNSPNPLKVRFTAVTDNHYFFLHKLYLEEWNADAPSSFDPVMVDPSVRSRICEDIGNSGVFVRYKKKSVDMTTIFATGGLLQNEDFFQNVVNSSAGPNARNKMNSFEETHNPYVLREFRVYEFFRDHPDTMPIPRTRKEYAFVCLLRDEDSDEMMPFYVSKAYNDADGLRIHRFVFPEFPKSEKNRFFYEYEMLMLAEGSAEVYSSRPDFDVENYYVQGRLRGMTSNEFDPVCKLNSKHLDNNQHLRLCNIVLTSPYFKENVEYPSRLHHDGWFEKRISFRNREIENLLEVTGVHYSERMLRCYAETDENDVRVFYISRAYNPRQVFVYLEDPSSKEIFLEALCINVGIVD